MKQYGEAIIGLGILGFGGALIFAHHERTVHGQSINGVPMQSVIMPIAGVQGLAPQLPVFTAVSPSIGTSSFTGLAILSGAVTAGCATGTVTVTPALAAGTYAVDITAVGSQGNGDRIIAATASLSADLTTVTINRCNTQAVTISGTSAMQFFVRLYKVG